MGVSKGSAGAAIRQIESGGDYSARGPRVKTGRYAGERAMGAYQVMPGNLPQWSKAALGRVVSESEFMASRDIQDAIFDHQFGSTMKKYGNFDDAASVWHSGSTMERARRRGATDGYSTTVDYVNKARGYYNGQSAPSQQAVNGFSSSSAAPDLANVAGLSDLQNNAAYAGTAQPSPAQLKAAKFAEDLNALANLRNTADQTSQRRQNIGTNPNSLLSRSKAAITQVLKSGVTS